ncbi:MAG: O-antigen ligase family protein [Thermoleophilia bacterium]
MLAQPVVDAPTAPTADDPPGHLDLDAIFGVVALAAPLVAAVVLAFASGGYFITTWGVASLVLIGVVALVVLGGRSGVGGRPAIAALAAWFAFGAWQGLSAGWSAEPAASQQAMAQTALYGAAFTLGLMGLRRPDWLRWLSAATLFAVWVPVTIAVAARLLPEQVGEDTFARLTWPITYWNGLGALAGFGFVLAIGLAGSRAVDGLVRVAAAGTAPVFGLALYLTLSRGAIVAVVVLLVLLVAFAPGRLETIAAGVVCIAASAVLAATAERAGNLVALGGELPEHAAEGRRVALLLLLMAALCAAAAGAAVAGTSRLRGRSRLVAGTAVSAVAVVTVVGGWTMAGPGGNPVSWADRQFESFKTFSSGARNDDSVTSRLAVAAGSGRWQNWGVAWDQWQDDVLTGTGAGDYRFEWNARREVDLYVVNAHSLYLEVLGETGLIGLLLLVTPLGITAAVAGTLLARRRGHPVARDVVVAGCAAGVVALHAAGDWDWQLPAVMLPATLLGSAALRAGLQGIGADRPAGWVVRAPMLAACVLAAVFTIGPVGSATLVDRGKAEARRGNLPAALRTALDAQALQGNAPAPRLLEAYVLTDLGRPAQADAAFAAALARSPRDWSIMADWAAALIQRGDRAAAVPLLRRAERLNPRERRVDLLRGLLSRS